MCAEVKRKKEAKNKNHRKRGTRKGEKKKTINVTPGATDETGKTVREKGRSSLKVKRSKKKVGQKKSRTGTSRECGRYSRGMGRILSSGEGTVSSRIGHTKDVGQKQGWTRTKETSTYEGRGRRGGNV